MTRSSTRPPTFSTRFPAGLVPGSASTGAMTADSWRAQRPAITPSVQIRFVDSTTLNGQPAVDLSGLTADQEFQAGFACNGVKATPTTPLPRNLPGLAVHFQPDQHPGAQHRGRRQEPAPHRAAKPVRRLHRRRQSFPRRQAQVEPAAHCRQCREQIRTVQLPFDLQRNALCDAACADCRNWLPLLTKRLVRHFRRSLGSETLLPRLRLRREAVHVESDHLRQRQ